MSHQFKGFHGKNIKNPKASEHSVATTSSSEISDYDSTVESRETTPVRNYSSGDINTIRRSDQGRAGVRRLIEQFSQSDSETSETENRTTRRRRSKQLEYQEIPPGGERELRKKMALQVQANNAMRVWTALIQDLKEILDEGDQALDANKPKEQLIGLLEGIEETSDNAWQSYEKVMEFQSSNVELEFVDITIAKNRLKSRVRKVTGHIKALKEDKQSNNTNTVHIVNPTGFGDLKLPEYDGDHCEFDSFESIFRKLINNGNLDEGGKAAHLLKCLKGEAKAYIGTDGTAAKTYEEIWSELRQRYGKAWRITRAAVKKMLDIPEPRNDSRDVVRYWNQIIDVCKSAERLNLTASSIILNTALLKLPAEYRGKLDEKLRPLSEDYILTRQMVAEPFNDVIAVELEKPSQIISTLGFNTSVGTANNQQFNRGKPKGKGGIKQFYCLLCQKKTNHTAAACNVYARGHQARNRLSVLGRCSNCSVPLDEHGPLCSHRAYCSAHPTQRHHYWLCDAGGNRGSHTHAITRPQFTPQQYQPQQYAPQHWPRGNNPRQQSQGYNQQAQGYNQQAQGYAQQHQGYPQQQHGQQYQQNKGSS